MIPIKTTGMISEDGTLTVKLPMQGIYTGTQTVVIILEEQQRKNKKQLKFSTYPVGQNIQSKFNRSEFYGEFGR